MKSYSTRMAMNLQALHWDPLKQGASSRSEHSNSSLAIRKYCSLLYPIPFPFADGLIPYYMKAPTQARQKGRNCSCSLSRQCAVPEWVNMADTRWNIQLLRDVYLFVFKNPEKKKANIVTQVLLFTLSPAHETGGQLECTSNNLLPGSRMQIVFINTHYTQK